LQTGSFTFTLDVLNACTNAIISVQSPLPRYDYDIRSNAPISTAQITWTNSKPTTCVSPFTYTLIDSDTLASVDPLVFTQVGGFI
jgi:hypothetical protein